MTLAVVWLRINIITPSFLFWSKQNGWQNPFIKNWLSGNESSNLDSDVIKISKLSLIISIKKSNLFLIELMFRWTMIVFLELFFRIFIINVSVCLFRSNRLAILTRFFCQWKEQIIPFSKCDVTDFLPKRCYLFYLSGDASYPEELLWFYYFKCILSVCVNNNFSNEY